MKDKLLNGYVLSTALVTTSAFAESIYRGVRGPTDWQADFRLVQSHKVAPNGATTDTTTVNNILKYWNGKEHGLFAFASVPFRSIDTVAGHSTGLADSAAGLGPRFSHDFNRTTSEKFADGTLHVLSALSTTFPTGNKGVKPPLGADKVVRANISGTYLWGGEAGNAYGIDFTQEFSRVAHNFDTSYTAVMVEKKVASNWRIAGDIKYLKNLGDERYVVTLAGGVRYIISPAAHFEFQIDHEVAVRNASRGTTTSLIGRINEWPLTKKKK